MKVLVVGSGGREHALCYRLARSEQVASVSCAPGNPGTARCGANVPLSPSALEELVSFARAEAIDLTVVGPEQPLCDGIVDRFTAAGLRILIALPSSLRNTADLRTVDSPGYWIAELRQDIRWRPVLFAAVGRTAKSAAD